MIHNYTKVTKIKTKNGTSEWSSKTTYTDLVCDCKCSMLRFETTEFDDMDVRDYEFTFLDDNLSSRKHNIFKRIWYAITGKPLWYSSLGIEDKDEMLRFLDECKSIVQGHDDFEEDSNII